MSQDTKLADATPEACFRCGLCAKSFSGPAPYIQHMQSSKHIKQKEKQDLLNHVATKEQTSLPPSPPALPAMGELKSVTPPPVQCGINTEAINYIKCDICQAPFTGPENAIQHYSGKKHQKAVQKQMLLKQIQRPPPVCTENLQQNQSVGNLSPNTREEPSSVMEEKAEKSSDLEWGTTSFEMEDGPEPQKVTVRYAEGYGCKCCGVLLFADLASAIEHYESDYHHAKKTP
ncbi:uncharacterized protein LOC135399036 [Ornithodoros turicata]|uniref:uncharacterized protein LOC135399036 n=1 Tax=Ornithodoros turicata TaxID=34597 RepID=UPI003139024E